MTAQVAQIWRHPIKAHGFEALEQTRVISGQTLPWDRRWAVTHEHSKNMDGAWASCANFSRGAKAPNLMAVEAQTNEADGLLTLSHPDQRDLEFDPDMPEGQAALLAWINPLMPQDRAASTGVIKATDQGMTDSAFPSISIANFATLRVLEQQAGQPLDTRRFRINFWVEGLAPFEEFEWLGQTLSVGDVAFQVEDRITRCASTMANPETGCRDADPLKVMEHHWGHRDFGMAMIAQTDGNVALGAPVALLP